MRIQDRPHKLFLSTFFFLLLLLLLSTQNFQPKEHDYNNNNNNHQTCSAFFSLRFTRVIVLAIVSKIRIVHSVSVCVNIRSIGVLYTSFFVLFGCMERTCARIGLEMINEHAADLSDYVAMDMADQMLFL